MASVRLYNTTFIEVTPTEGLIKGDLVAMQETDPDPKYDFIHQVTLDFNKIAEAFNYKVDSVKSEHLAAGEAQTWRRLHEVLSTGMSDGVAHNSKTTLKDDAPIDTSSWDVFWTGLLSYAIDKTDTNGASVKVTEVKKRIDFFDNLGGHTPATVLAQKFVNDITGKMNDSLGAVTTKRTAAPDNFVEALEANPFKTSLGKAPQVGSNFIAALAVYAYSKQKDRLLGDANGIDGCKFALKANDGIGIRIKCTIQSSSTGLILITQK